MFFCLFFYWKCFYCTLIQWNKAKENVNVVVFHPMLDLKTKILTPLNHSEPERLFFFYATRWDWMMNVFHKTHTLYFNIYILLLLLLKLDSDHCMLLFCMENRDQLGDFSCFIKKRIKSCGFGLGLSWCE